MFNWWLQRDHGPQGSGNQRYSSVTQSSQHEEDDVEKMNQALRNLEKQDSKNEDNAVSARARLRAPPPLESADLFEEYLGATSPTHLRPMPYPHDESSSAPSADATNRPSSNLEAGQQSRDHPASASAHIWAPSNRYLAVLAEQRRKLEQERTNSSAASSASQYENRVVSISAHGHHDAKNAEESGEFIPPASSGDDAHDADARIGRLRQQLREMRALNKTAQVVKRMIEEDPSRSAAATTSVVGMRTSNPAPSTSVADDVPPAAPSVHLLPSSSAATSSFAWNSSAGSAAATGATAIAPLPVDTFVPTTSGDPMPFFKPHAAAAVGAADRQRERRRQTFVSHSNAAVAGDTGSGASSSAAAQLAQLASREAAGARSASAGSSLAVDASEPIRFARPAAGRPVPLSAGRTDPRSSPRSHHDRDLAIGGVHAKALPVSFTASPPPRGPTSSPSVRETSRSAATTITNSVLPTMGDPFAPQQLALGRTEQKVVNLDDPELEILVSADTYKEHRYRGSRRRRAVPQAAFVRFEDDASLAPAAAGHQEARSFSNWFMQRNASQGLLSEEQLLQLFDHYDTNADGAIEVGDVKVMVPHFLQAVTAWTKNLREKFPQAEMQVLLSPFEQRLLAAQQSSGIMRLSKELHEAMDQSRSGALSKSQFVQSFNRAMHEVMESELNMGSLRGLLAPKHPNTQTHRIAASAASRAGEEPNTAASTSTSNVQATAAPTSTAPLQLQGATQPARRVRVDASFGQRSQPPGHVATLANTTGQPTITFLSGHVRAARVPMSSAQARDGVNPTTKKSSSKKSVPKEPPSTKLRDRSGVLTGSSARGPLFSAVLRAPLGPSAERDMGNYQFVHGSVPESDSDEELHTRTREKTTRGSVYDSRLQQDSAFNPLARFARWNAVRKAARTPDDMTVTVDRAGVRYEVPKPRDGTNVAKPDLRALASRYRAEREMYANEEDEKERPASASRTQDSASKQDANTISVATGGRRD